LPPKYCPAYPRSNGASPRNYSHRLRAPQRSKPWQLQQLLHPTASNIEQTEPCSGRNRPRLRLPPARSRRPTPNPSRRRRSRTSMACLATQTSQAASSRQKYQPASPTRRLHPTSSNRQPKEWYNAASLRGPLRSAGRGRLPTAAARCRFPPVAAARGAAPGACQARSCPRRWPRGTEGRKPSCKLQHASPSSESPLPSRRSIQLQHACSASGKKIAACDVQRLSEEEERQQWLCL
ncbi:unnamed protein product, partial [Urochloa humidicola]